MARPIRLCVLGLLVVLSGCPDEESSSPDAAPPPPETLSDRETGVFLKSPGRDWTLWGREAVRERDPEEVAGLTDGQRCVGVVRMREVGEDLRLEPVARERVAALRAEGDRLDRFDRVPYVGASAVRFALSGERDGEPWAARVTMVVVAPEDGPRRLYEVRAESSAPLHVMARRCFDTVTAAFDAWR